MLKAEALDTMKMLLLLHPNAIRYMFSRAVEGTQLIHGVQLSIFFACPGGIAITA